MRAHLGAGLDDQTRVTSLASQRRVARYVENHDEQRAVTAFGMEGSLTAAVAALTLPGLRLFHQGQIEGRRLRLPVQLGRHHLEAPKPSVESLYRRLPAEPALPVFQDGDWRVLERREALTETQVTAIS